MKKYLNNKDIEKNTILTKEETLNIFYNIKGMINKWLEDKKDDWLKSSSIIMENKAYNFKIILMQIKNLSYHIGQIELFFNENNVIFENSNEASSIGYIREER